MKHSRTIRKIVLGPNPLNGLAYVVGYPPANSMPQFKVTGILGFVENGIDKYNIYLRKMDDYEYIWKSAESIAARVEINNPEGEDVVTVTGK